MGSDGKNARGNNTHNHESMTQNLTWFGRQLQPTSTQAILRFTLYLVAHQLQVQ